MHDWFRSSCKLVKVGNREGLLIELLARGATTENVPVAVMARKKLLHWLEMQHLMDGGLHESEAKSHKTFRVQSNAEFKLLVEDLKIVENPKTQLSDDWKPKNKPVWTA